MKVRDPQGQAWRVSRRWVPWRRRLKGFLDAMPSGPSFGDDPISLVLGLLFLLVAIPLLLIVALGAVELLAMLAVLPFAILARVLLGRHWVVEVRHGWTPYWEGPGGGWRSSRAEIARLAEAIRAGDTPPPNLGGFVTDG